MTVHKCDCCGKEMGVWLICTTTIGSKFQSTNIYDLMALGGSKEYCKECYLKMLSVCADKN